MTTRLASIILAATLIADTSPATAASPCAGNASALGVTRTVEIDTTAGPGFGFEHYKVHDFLEPKEVVLTFDDGPQVTTTKAILDALDAHCAKATFFSIGKMALGMPEIIRDVAKRGHTVGTHTWSHARLRKAKSSDDAVSEIERGFSAVNRAVGSPISPFFRYPVLEDTKETLEHLSNRNIAIFSTDIDSRDYVPQTPDRLVKAVMDKLEKKGKGIVLMHDIQPTTAKAMPLLLGELKAKGYKLVHLTAKHDAQTIAEFDQLIEKDVKGLPAAASSRPTSSVVKTIKRGE
jgi:peptidoglycan/xylan/chitin deacetylase (PgdA/CDA1 family)